MKKCLFVISFLLLAGCQENVMTENLQQNENVEQMQENENTTFSNELEPFVKAVEEMNSWTSVHLNYEFFETFADEVRVNSQLHVENYFVDSPRQLYRSSHYIAFQNSFDELYYIEDEGGFTRRNIESWEDTIVDEDAITNSIPSLVPFFEYMLQVAELTNEDEVGKFIVDKTYYNEFYRQLNAAFFSINVSDEDIEQELGTINHIEIQLELQKSKLAHYRIVITSIGFEQQENEFVLEGNFTKPNELTAIPRRDDL